MDMFFANIHRKKRQCSFGGWTSRLAGNQ